MGTTEPNRDDDEFIAVDAGAGLELFPAEEPAREADDPTRALPTSGHGLLAIVSAGPPAAQHAPRVRRHRRTQRLLSLAAAGKLRIARLRASFERFRPVMVRRLQFLASHVNGRVESVVESVGRVQWSTEHVAVLTCLLLVAVSAYARMTYERSSPFDWIRAADPLPLTAVARMSLMDLRPAVRDVRAPASGQLEPAQSADVQRIRRVLNKYRDAFSILDARGAKTVWPAVDATGLAARFARLAHQNYEFDNCAIRVGEENAEATCRGLVEYQPLGSRVTRREPRAWQFALRKQHDDWLIDAVDRP